jgi:hypothetical protein
MRMLADKITYVNDTLMAVVESQSYAKVASVFGRSDVNIVHN